MNDEAVRAAYERVPYPSASEHHTHPDHLATLSLLHGLEPAALETCRVLELGCADGGNLLPMALELPEARFVGIDLSPRQIEAGQKQAEELGVRNVDLRAMSILDVDESLGTFDYVICHGVFSWVTDDVQEKILAICRAHLAPQGVAYVSYNTLPGWHLRRMIRDMALFHTRGIDDPEKQVERAFELINFLADSAGQSTDAHSIFFRTAREHLEEYRDRPSYLLHEYLEATNTPLYFHDFAARAARHGLQYLGEAEPALMEIANLPPNVATTLKGFANDRLELEQYLDFVLNRTFRRTLLCHAGHTIDRAMKPERMRRLYAATAAKPLSPSPDLRAGISESFKTGREKPFSSSHPMAKAVVVSLASIWPRAASFDELLRDVRARLGGQAEDEVLPDLLYSLFWSGVVELHVKPPLCVETVGTFPRAASLARRQAMAGTLVTNQRRRVINLDDPVARFLLPYVDGTRDRAALVRLLDREVAAGRLDLSTDGQTVRQPDRFLAVLQAVVEHHLRKMAEYALLVG